MDGERGGDILSPSAWASVTELAPYFPFPVQEQIDCELLSINWGSGYNLPAVGRPVTVHLQGITLGEVTLDLD